MSWTDERIALLKKMWKEGKSAAEIAKTLAKGVTRNAVIGKAHRMGLSGRPSPIKKPVPVKKENALKKASLPKEPKRGVLPNAGGAKNPLFAKEAEELKKLEKETVQIGGGIALIELTERMCKWPIGDPKEADFSFCGRGIRQGTPYCADHASMAYQTSSRRGTPVAAVAANDKEDGADEEAVETAEDEEEADEVVA